MTQPNRDTEKVKRAVEWVKARASPGIRDPDRKYAETAYAAFDEINALREERNGLALIAEGFAAVGMLPQDPDPSALGRALKREEARRERIKTRKQVSNASGTAEINLGANPSGGGAAESPAILKRLQCREDVEIMKIPTAPVSEGLQLNPDNTFVIRPIDPNDLPDIRNINGTKKIARGGNEK
jgi:hypothetical protein